MSGERRPSIVLATSVVLHAAAFAWFGSARGESFARAWTQEIEIVEIEPPEATPTKAVVEAREEPRPAPAARHVVTTAPAPHVDPSPHPAADEPPPAYGVALAGLVGASDGLAIPIGDPNGVRGGTGRARTSTRSLAPASGDGTRTNAARCSDPDTAAVPRSVPRVAYTPEAIEAHVEGRVRIHVTVDEEGRVRDAEVVSPLGHGLDEEALAALREARFEPATHCGRVVETSFVLGVRFAL